MAPILSVSDGIQGRSHIPVFLQDLVSTFFIHVFVSLSRLRVPSTWQYNAGNLIVHSYYMTKPCKSSFSDPVDTSVSLCPNSFRINSYESCLVWSFPIFFLASSFPPLESSFRPPSVGISIRINTSVLE